MDAIWKQPDGNGGYFVVYHVTTAEQVTYSDTTVAAVLANSPLANASDFGKNLLQASNAKAARKIIGVNADPFFDECGNNWDFLGTPYLSENNAKFGKALQLDGSSHIGFYDFAAGGADFAVAGWFCPTLNSSLTTFFSAGSLADGFVVCTNAANLQLWTANGINLATDPCPSTLFHLELDYINASQTFLVFVNGTKVYEAQDSSFATQKTFPYFLLGENSATPNHKLIGSVDEVIITRKALHNADFTPPTAPYEADSDTVALLHFGGGE